MTTVAGIDLSLTSTGMALATVDSDDTSFKVSATSSIETRLAVSKGKTKDSLEQRFARQSTLYSQITEWVWSADLIVIEGLFSAGQVGGSQIDRCGLWWRVVGGLMNKGHRVIVVSPLQAKKFLTGAGNADKGTMVRRAGQLWSDWEPSTPSSSEDEADAIALASVGLGVLDLAPFDMAGYRVELATKLKEQLQ